MPELEGIINGIRKFEGAYIQKFYELGNNEFRIKVRKDSNADIFFEIGKCIFQTKYLREGMHTPFEQAVRKRIANAVIKEISLMQNDRIVLFDLHGKEDAKLIIELFGTGNIIIADPSMHIALAYKTGMLSGREIKKGSIYVPPIKGEHSKNFVSELAQRYNLPPLYIEEAMHRSGIEKNREKLEKLSSSELERIEAKAKEVSDEIKNGKGYVYLDKGIAVECSSIELAKYSGKEKREFASLGEALDFAYSTLPEEKKESRAETGLKASIEKQKEYVQQCTIDEKENRDIGNAIFSNIYIINQIIDILRANKHMTADELQRLFPNVKIKEVDLKNKKVKIELM